MTHPSLSSISRISLLLLGLTGCATPRPLPAPAVPAETPGSGRPLLERIYGTRTELGEEDLYAGPSGASFASRIMGVTIRVEPGVFLPGEAEDRVLPFMRANSKDFQGKAVLEVGCGSGLVSLYAAALGARRVVATDINPNAIKTTAENARTLGHGQILEARLVSGADASAYAVLKPGERFDTIISNPPYSLDLDAKGNSAVTDSGSLAFSMVRELKQRLNPGGRALLFFDSLFYQLVIVKYAKHLGYAVTFEPSRQMMGWQTEVLYNAYLARVLEREGLKADAFRFDWRADPIDQLSSPEQIRADEARGAFPGWIVIALP